MSDRPVVTRIAPSPTGWMHIGTARTALFNWLFARHHRGRFLLRIEDTDRERSTPGAVQAIHDGLAWLGLAPDGPPVFQHARADRHRAAVASLLETGRAYRCFMSIEELALERERARADGRAIRSPWRDRTGQPGSNIPFVIRFKGPLEGETVVDDLIKGPIVFRNQELDDLVLLRSDGAPTYNLAVVVDDHDMDITHVIRGDDHLNNAARQLLIYRALAFEPPAFAHVPMIHGPDGAKLSKRHGAQAVGDFAALGYLPEAMRNYLAHLGWSHGDDEFFTDDQAIAWFDIRDVGSSPSRLDWDKLGHVNNHYIRSADNTRLVTLALGFLTEQGEPLPVDAKARLARVAPLVKEGAQTIVDLARLSAFALTPRPVLVAEKDRPLFTAETLSRLQRLRLTLAECSPWAPDHLLAALRTFAAGEKVGLGKIGPALRAALSGGAAAPDLASALAALGREESLGRIDDTLSQLR